MIALPIILAASLASPGLGNFTPLPPDVPAAATSHDTPGSDPADLTGWYVGEGYWTNHLEYGEWAVTGIVANISSLPTIALSAKPSYVGNSAWKISPIGQEIVNRFNEWRPSTNYQCILSYSVRNEISGAETATRLSGLAVSMVAQLASGRTATLEGDFRAIRPTLVVSNFVGCVTNRAARLTPGVCAGVYSSFEGCFERQYYSLEGQSNVWDAAVYGPRNSLSNFWFNPFAETYEPVELYATNYRPRATRRLWQYSDLEKLADHLRDTISARAFVVTGVPRPGWIDPGDDYDYNAWWSTTADGIFDSAAAIMPSFSWTADPLAARSNEWKSCCQSLTSLVVDGDRTWDYGYHYRNRWPWGFYPLEDLLTDLQFSNKQTYPIDDCIYHDPRTYEGILTNVYPHTNAHGITNVTRRLRSEWLANVNQTLGLMDRTYHQPEILYPSVSTNTIFTHRRSASATATATLVRQDWGQYGLWTCELVPDTAVWSSASDEWFAEDTERTNLASRLEWRTTPTTTAPSSSAQAADRGTDAWSVKLDAADLFAMHGESFAPPFTDIFRITGMYHPEYPETFENEICLLTDSPSLQQLWVSLNSILPDDGYVSNVSVTVGMSYTRSYEFWRTASRMTAPDGFTRIDWPSLGPTQPGRLGWQRCDNASCGILAALHTNTNNAGIYGTLVWSDDYDSRAAYKSTEAVYSSRQTLLNTLGSVSDSIYDRWRTSFDFDPLNYQWLLAIDAGDFSTVRDSTGGAFSIGYNVNTSKYVKAVIEGSLSEGITGYHYYQGPTDDGPWTEITADAPFVPLTVDVSGVLTNAIPDVTEHHACSGEGRLGVMTRVDWNWNALKRTDD